MTEDEILRATRLWTRLTDALDLHGKKWYIFDTAAGEWQRIGFERIHDALFEMGVGEPPAFEPIKTYIDGKLVVTGQRLIPDLERALIIRQFIQRDRESHPRLTEDVKRAKMRMKVQLDFFKDIGRTSEERDF